MGFIFPIILALLIDQIGSKKIEGFVQTVTYMPHFISVVVIVSMLNIFLSPGSGILGRFFGDESLMGSTSAITAVYWISEVWQHVGWNSIIYLAALAGVDTSLYEAAKIDGAGRLQSIRYVDLPAIMPTCAILLIMNMGSVLNVGFDKIYLMQNSLNMPATEVIATYTYKIGIINGQYSYSTAIGLFNTLVNFVFPDHRERDRQARFRYEHFLGGSHHVCNNNRGRCPKQERYSLEQACTSEENAR